MLFGDILLGQGQKEAQIGDYGIFGKLWTGTSLQLRLMWGVLNCKF